MRDRLTTSFASQKWPLLTLTVAVGIGALVVLNGLHQREATARAAAPKAEQLAVEMFDMMEVARTVRNELPADDTSKIPAVLGANRDRAAQRRLNELDAILRDPAETRRIHQRFTEMRQMQERNRRLANGSGARDARIAPPRSRPRIPRAPDGGAAMVDGLPNLPPPDEARPGRPLSPREAQRRLVEAVSAEAVAVARRQRDRAEAIGRQTLIGAGAVLAAALLLIVGLSLRGQRRLRDAHRDHAEHLRRLADEDALTGLANRRVLDGDLAALTANVDRAAPVQVFLSDLDGFKGLNDSLGHEAGDRLLAEFAARLADAAGEDGRAYRLGGDEFCVVGRPGADIAERVAAATSGFGPEGVSGTVGMAVWPDEAADGSAALKLADQRMYAGKRSSRVAA